MVSRRFGATYANGSATFSLWAPGQASIELHIRGRDPQTMLLQDGWHELEVACQPGDLYKFIVGERTIADPAAAAQAGPVKGWSVVTDPKSYDWVCDGWKGRPWHEAVIYEMHPGLSGGFTGIAERLPALADLGFTAIELMPIAQFPGSWNWGYDGVLAFAPDRSYGTPDELKALVDAAHSNGLMIFLDVVYNHFGPDGNYLPTSTPEFFRDDINTPWGWAIDFRRPEVRQFYRENVETWLGEFRFDGLRFDAVHAMVDEGWLEEMAAHARRTFADRNIHLVLENDDNVAEFLRNGFDAQWNDDYHHALHVLLTGETAAYYGDYADDPAHALLKALQSGFIYQGQPSAYRKGEPRGTPSGDLLPMAFVNFLQNHDQIGNRAFGERLTVLTEPKRLKAAIALLLLAPQIPLVFMGEEIGSEAPFHYFVDHQPDLVEAIIEGRQREFEKLVSGTDTLPEPNATETFENSAPETNAPVQAEWVAFYRSLLDLRTTRLMPHLQGVRAAGGSVLSETAVISRWQLGNGDMLTIATNLGDADVSGDVPAERPFWGDVEGDVLAANTTAAWLSKSQ